jgi:hypothetical protein
MADGPRKDDPRSERRKPQPPRPDEKRKGRDMTREDADSPHAIPIYPPQGDGS